MRTICHLTVTLGAEKHVNTHTCEITVASCQSLREAYELHNIIYDCEYCYNIPSNQTLVTKILVTSSNQNISHQYMNSTKVQNPRRRMQVALLESSVFI